MADKMIDVDQNGNVSDPAAKVKRRQKVIWESTHGPFTVEFPGGSPFSDLGWLDGKETGERVSGKIRLIGTSGRHFPYQVFVHQTLMDLVPSSGPELIVDGGRSKKKKTAVTRKVKAAVRALKAKAAKRAGAKKSARSAGRKKSAKKAVKSGARKKR